MKPSTSSLASSLSKRAKSDFWLSSVIPLSVSATPKNCNPVTMTPSVCERRWTRLRATALGWKPTDVIAASTAWRVAGDTSGRLLMTRETVCIETPHMAAISRIVTLCWRGMVPTPSDGGRLVGAFRVW